MKTHIFIATTQGLVAIQNITPIDDEDINSVVSVNGTSTTANISGSYHNFVKKGVGIIQQMFGACSYRVDISARIDQGNSWQVAMYLAHLAQSKGLLGSGDVNKGDTVICATGEVNTSNHQILAVGEVAMKFKLAQPQLDKWAALGAKVKFLLPQANQLDVKENSYILLVSSLEQAATALPNTINHHLSANTKSKKLVSINSPHTAYIAVFFLALIIFWGLRKLISANSNTALPLVKTNNTSLTNLTKPIQLVALFKQGKTCAQTSKKDITVNNEVFADLTLKPLCSLYLRTNQSISQVLLIAQDAYTVLPLIQNQQGWQIPLPKYRISDRQYFLVTIKQKLSEEKIEQLRLYREAMSKPSMLTEALLANWLKSQNTEFSTYTHKLVVE